MIEDNRTGAAKSAFDSGAAERETAMKAGETKAATGRRLLTEPPQNVGAGIALTRAAAEEGSPKAAHLMAVLMASGLGMAQDLVRALDYLEQAARGGYRRAQADLAALAGEWGLAETLRGAEEQPGIDRFATLRARIDLDGWMNPPPLQWLCASPRIAVSVPFLPPEACDWLIAAGKPLLKAAETFDRETGALIVETGRSNSAAGLTLGQADLVQVFVRARIAALTGSAVVMFEDANVLHYAPGQEFAAHHDFLDPASPGYAAQVARYGQRVLTFLIYLNGAYEGGETDFPYLRQRYGGQRGEALCFWNVTPEGTPDPRTLHAGLTPLRGEKWLFSQWVRGR